MKTKSIVSLFVMLLAVGVHAKTVALWPFGFDGSAFNGSDISGNGHAFSAMGTAAQLMTRDAPAFSFLPPNPDRLIQNVFFNESSCRFPATNTYLESQDADLLGKINPSCGDFTIEGWLKIHELPEKEKWSCLMQAVSTANGKNTWMLSLRHSRKDDDGNYYLDFEIYHDNGDKIFCKIDDSMAERLTNQWNHLSLVYRKADAEKSNKPTFGIYLNETEIGSAHTAIVNDAPISTFRFGGRTDWDKTTYASYDYWRVSDIALSPGVKG